MLSARTTPELNEFDAPGAGVQGTTRAHDFIAPGAPVQNLFQNDPLKNFQLGKKSEISVAKPTPQEGVIVKKGEYYASVGQEMYDWFCSKEKFKVVADSFVWKNGQVEEKHRNVPLPPPHFSEFARKIGVTWKTLRGWAKTHKEFADFYEACVDVIQEFYIDNGVTGSYAGQFSIFAAKNTTKMKDVQINKNENYNMKDVLDAIEKGAKLQDPNDI